MTLTINVTYFSRRNLSCTRLDLSVVTKLGYCQTGGHCTHDVTLVASAAVCSNLRILIQPFSERAVLDTIFFLP